MILTNLGLVPFTFAAIPLSTCGPHPKIMLELTQTTPTSSALLMPLQEPSLPSSPFSLHGVLHVEFLIHLIIEAVNTAITKFLL